jgi:pyrophosphatase PpaX
MTNTGYSDRGYSGVFFDWDGCLADTLDLWMELYKRSLSKRGIRAGEQSIVRELFNDWSGPERFGVRDGQAFSAEVISGLEERISTVTLDPSARETLEELKRAGKRIAILTGSKRAFVEPVLAREGIASMVDLLICLDDVSRHKPDPEPVQRALESLSLPRDKAIMVGDSSKDIQMGKNAGITTILYLPDKNLRFYAPDWLSSFGPEHTIRDFSELPAIVGQVAP